MKKLHVNMILLSCLTTNLMVGQLDQSRSSLVITGNNIHLPSDYLRNNLLGNNEFPENLIGSQYFKKDFAPSRIIVNDSASYMAMLRYNAYSDEIEIQKDGKISALFKRPYLKAKIENTNFEIKDYKTEDGQKTGYFQPLTLGPTILFKRTTKEFVPARPAKSNYVKDTQATFNDHVNYYISIEGEALLKEIKPKQKKFLELLNADNELQKFIKQNNINLKEEQDLIQVIQYYNNMASSKVK